MFQFDVQESSLKGKLIIYKHHISLPFFFMRYTFIEKETTLFAIRLPFTVKDKVFTKNVL